MTALETYIRALTARRDRTVAETALYGTLETLLNAAGDELRPKVNAFTHPRRGEAGIPDMALWDENQEPEQKPARGVVEVKPTSADLIRITQSKQVADYLAAYGQVLVTNLYQFVLVTRAADGSPQLEERYNLAESEALFWQLASTPRTLANEHDTPLREYLKRVMRRNAPLASPQDVAWMLASYARQAKARLEVDNTDMRALSVIRAQLEAALGVRFEDDMAEDFFRSTLVQTLFYGVFSAWVLWHERRPAAGARFDLWRDTRRLNVPVVQELFEQFSASTALPSSIERILEWTADALNRVDRAVFFERFNEGAAVQYFYEPFLEAFDPDLRRQLGVWYTPPEVVDYMVARVDAALKTELNIPDGLADPRVCILDPCCGTGAYLVAVLRRIYDMLRGRDGDTLAAQAVQTAMRERVFGFEILPAPFVVAHLQIGILLTEIHAPLTAGQRAGVYLTNALTGWEPATEPKTQIMFRELEREREASDDVKQNRDILVILGNPPYSGYAGVAIKEEQKLLDAYRTTVDPELPRPQGQGLNDLYVRFYRMAERRIAEHTGRGIVCFISNYSWLDGLSHTGMRERFLDAFDQIYIDNLHGDRIISEVAPDGRTSETVFAMRGTSPGIRIGTGIATLIRKPSRGAAQTTLYYRDFEQARADDRRQALLASLQEPNFTARYVQLTPLIKLGLPFKPRRVDGDYLEWAKLPDLFPASFPGVKTSRDSDLVEIDRQKLVQRMQQYFNPAISHSEMRVYAPSLLSDGSRFAAQQVRETLLKRGFLPDNIIRYSYRPFDVRWLYWEPETKLLDEKRPEYFPHTLEQNPFIFLTNRTRRSEIQPPLLVTRLNDINSMDGSAAGFPLYLYPVVTEQPGLFDDPAPPARTPNLSDHAREYLAGVGLSADDGAPLLFYHALAVMHAPAYRLENAGALRQDFPRIPLPGGADALAESATLGRQVAALLDVEQDVPGVTTGDPRAELRGIAELTTVDNRPPDFNVNVNWGYFGSRSAVMPGRGRTNEHDGVIDVYLNDSTYWRGIPAEVWAYTLGGYQVLKKWLSYRETDVLGRPLRADEARTFMHIARRIAALLALNEQLDANYRAVSADQN